MYSCHSDQPHDARAQRVRTISIWPDTVTVGAGDTLRFRIFYRSAENVVIDGPAAVWSTSDSGIARIANGLLVATRPGAATIVASSDGILGFAHVSVADKSKPSPHNTGRAQEN
jgi:hypothetical protein